LKKLLKKVLGKEQVVLSNTFLWPIKSKQELSRAEQHIKEGDNFINEVF
jgi:hypothetical protein